MRTSHERSRVRGDAKSRRLLKRVFECKRRATTDRATGSSSNCELLFESNANLELCLSRHAR